MIHGIEVIHIVHDCLFVSIQNETDNKPICSGSDFHFWQVHLAVFFRWHQLQTCMLSVNIQSVFSLNFCWQSVWFEIKSLRYFPGFVLIRGDTNFSTRVIDQGAWGQISCSVLSNDWIQFAAQTINPERNSSLSMEEPKSITIDGHKVSWRTN